MEDLEHPPFSPNLILCDFDLIPQLKKPLRGKRFAIREDILLIAFRRQVLHIDCTNACIIVGKDVLKPLKGFKLPGVAWSGITTPDQVPATRSSEHGSRTRRATRITAQTLHGRHVQKMRNGEVGADKPTCNVIGCRKLERRDYSSNTNGFNDDSDTVNSDDGCSGNDIDGGGNFIGDACGGACGANSGDGYHCGSGSNGGDDLVVVLIVMLTIMVLMMVIMMILKVMMSVITMIVVVMMIMLLGDEVMTVTVMMMIMVISVKTIIFVDINNGDEDNSDDYSGDEDDDDLCDSGLTMIRNISDGSHYGDDGDSDDCSVYINNGDEGNSDDYSSDEDDDDCCDSGVTMIRNISDVNPNSQRLVRNKNRDVGTLQKTPGGGQEEEGRMLGLDARGGVYMRLLTMDRTAQLSPETAAFAVVRGSF
ncbi:hypothetical protein ANN_14343 [Periplaneta americana]|uniref:Uncharacterized protein n=1 Tax=Periplaneta americana TaxID=6978 RepID=A0ABQ8SWM8_PERAM|nr:hypothetical protein ANN_14343 [Periplaneta americana]